MTDMLQAKDVSVRLSGRRVLQSVSLTVRAGEIVAVIGANGAGKSTFLKVIAGLLIPGEGSVSLGKQALTALEPRALGREIAYLPQDRTVN
jgi:iron complex transport system ATP-binding protein